MVKYKVAVSAILLVALVMLVKTATAPRPYRAFVLGMPETVEAAPGDTVEINGTILNTGYFWLHDFNLTADGLPKEFNVTFEPSWFDNVRILRNWNEVQGLYIVPETFVMKIDIPPTSAGVFAVTVKGQEFQSWRQVSNTTAFMLRVTSTPKVSLSDIVVPEQVFVNQSFNVSFDVKNEGLLDQLVNLTLAAPQDWVVEPAEQSVIVKVNASQHVEFSIVPTNTSGDISVLMEYPYKSHLFNITKSGPYLIPIETGEKLTGLTAWIDQLKQLPIAIILVALALIAIIIWNLWKIAQHYKFRVVRKKPEDFKRLTELPIEQL